MGRLGPDPAVDQELAVVGQVHERGEVLAQADRVDDREPDLPGGDRGQVAEHHRLEDLHGLDLARVGRLDQHRPLGGERDHGGEREARRVVGLEPFVAREAVGDLGEVDVERAEPEGGRDGGRRLPGVEVGRVHPVEEQAGALAPDLFDGRPELVEPALPAVHDRVPDLLMLAIGGRPMLAVRVLELARLGVEPLLDLGQASRVSLVGLREGLVAAPLDLLQEGRILGLGRGRVRLATLLELGREARELVVGVAQVGVAALLDLGLLPVEGRLGPIDALAVERLGAGPSPPGTAGAAGRPASRRPTSTTGGPPPRAPRRSRRRATGRSTSRGKSRADRPPRARGSRRARRTAGRRGTGGRANCARGASRSSASLTPSWNAGSGSSGGGSSIAAPSAARAAMYFRQVASGPAACCRIVSSSSAEAAISASAFLFRLIAESLADS